MNMSYCMFHNTLQDLEQCQRGWLEPSSDDEKKAKTQMIKIMRQLLSLEEAIADGVHGYNAEVALELLQEDSDRVLVKSGNGYWYVENPEEGWRERI